MGFRAAAHGGPLGRGAPRISAELPELSALSAVFGQAEDDATVLKRRAVLHDKTRTHVVTKNLARQLDR
jgi:hypothetical protein